MPYRHYQRYKDSMSSLVKAGSHYDASASFVLFCQPPLEDARSQFNVSTINQRTVPYRASDNYFTLRPTPPLQFEREHGADDVHEAAKVCPCPRAFVGFNKRKKEDLKRHLNV